MELPTLLKNHTLHVEVAQYEIRSPIPPHHSSFMKRVVANGLVVLLPDIPSRNGAVHIIDKLLNPRGNKGGHHPHHPGAMAPVDDEDEWEGWEEWLVQWAEEN